MRLDTIVPLEFRIIAVPPAPYLIVTLPPVSAITVVALVAVFKSIVPTGVFTLLIEFAFLISYLILSLTNLAWEKTSCWALDLALPPIMFNANGIMAAKTIDTKAI